MASPSIEASGSFSCPTETTSVRDRTVTYASFGDPSGAPVVALHGMPGSRAFGALLDAPARERGVRVLAPDRPGVGGSERVPGRRVVDGAGFVEGFLDALDVDAAGVLGFSAGGPHALACASECPDRLAGTAVLASPAPPEADVPRARLARATNALARRTSLGLGAASWLQATLLSRQDGDALLGLFTDADLGNAVVYDDATVPEVLAVDADLATAQGHRALFDESRALATDWGFDVGAVGAPVHVYHGTRDENVPLAAADYFERMLADAHGHRADADHLELVLERAGDALDAAAGR